MPKISTIFKFLFAATLIFLLVKSGRLDFSLVADLAQSWTAVYGLVLMGVILFLQACRWNLLLKARGFQVSTLEANKLSLIGVFFSYVLPGSSSGDLVKAYYVVKDHPQRRMDAALSVLVDRMIGVYSIVFVGVVSMLINWRLMTSNPQLYLWFWGALALFTMMTVFLGTGFSGSWLRFQHWIAKLPQGQRFIRLSSLMGSYGNSKTHLLGAFMLSIGAQLIGIGFMVMVGHAIGESDIGLGAYFFAVPLGSIASALPLTPAGIGVGQVAFLFLFQIYSGKISMLGQTAITATQLVQFVWGLLGAVFYLSRRGAGYQVDPVTPAEPS